MRISLSHIQEILEIRNDFERTKLAGANRHDIHVRFRLVTVRIVSEILNPVPGSFDSHSIDAGLLEHQITAESVTWNQWY
jgi:hypothetical protein